MYIVAGKLKGRKLKVLKGMRVVEARVRKALYDLLAENMPGSVVLDIFAGSGSLGIEAVSWGAKKVVFVEKTGRNSRLIQDNCKRLDCAAEFSVFQEDVFSFLKHSASEKYYFDYIFFDPPYKENILTKTLKSLAGYDILTPQTFVVSLGSVRESLEIAKGWQRVFVRCYGDRQVMILKMR